MMKNGLGHRYTYSKNKRTMMKNLLLFLALVISVHLLRAQTSVTLYATGFNGAHGLCFDASGNLYVTNRDGNTVSKIDPSGTIIATYTGFNHPLGIAIDQAGNLYVANDYSNSVSKVNASGVIVATYTGFLVPTALCFDAAGNLYVANGGNSSVSKVDANGNIIATFTGFSLPAGIACDGAGNLYVANEFGSTGVSKVDANGNITNNTGFSYPTALGFDDSGNLYVSQIDGFSISMVPAGSGDGAMPVTIASGLSYVPYGIAYRDNALYVTDGDSNVYKVTGGALALPLKLVDFSVQKQGGVAMLDWQTVNEVNTAGFDVQRSTDGIVYKSVGRLSAIGKEVNRYHFSDELSSVNSSTVYYRLQMRDMDGSARYSKVVEIQLNGSSSPFSVYPNPANGYINVWMPQEKNYIDMKTEWAGKAAIYNISGVLLKTVKLVAGINKIDVRDLASGTYFIVSGSNKVKFIKQ